MPHGIAAKPEMPVMAVADVGQIREKTSDNMYAEGDWDRRHACYLRFSVRPDRCGAVMRPRLPPHSVSLKKDLPFYSMRAI